MTIGIENEAGSQPGPDILVATGIVTNRNRFLAGLPPEVFGQIAPFLKERPLRPGQILHQPGSPAQEICFPYAGAVSIRELLREGDAVAVALLGPESAVGLSAGLGSMLPVSRAVVELPGTAGYISTQRFAAVAASSDTLRTLIARHGDALLAQVQRTAACNVRHAAEARVCRWLLQNADAAGAGTLAMTQESIGELLGLRRTTITLTAQSLQAKNVIKYKRGSITIVDPAALRAIACDCYATIRNISQQVEP